MTLEEYDDRYNPDPTPLYNVVKGTLWGVVLCGLIWLLTGCTTPTKIVEVPTVHTEYIHQTDTLLYRDSIHTRDSIYIIQRGDTIYHNAYHTIYKDRLVYNTHTDTVNKTDTLTVVKTVEVERRQSWLKRTFGKIEDSVLLAALMVGLVLGLRWWLGRMKN